MKLTSYSQSAQDIFVLSVLDQKKKGTYLEIGSSVPVDNNNTYLLETEFNWTGLSFELDEKRNELFRLIRKNPVIGGDATKHDYTKIVKDNKLGKHIDYLQIDVDPYWQTFNCLKNIDFDKITFSVITYEHDLWCGGKDERLESRKILESNGYTRVVSDLMDGPLPFEDWYVNEKYMKSDTWKQFVGENVSAERIRNDLMDHLRKQYDYEMAWWYTG